MFYLRESIFSSTLHSAMGVQAVCIKKGVGHENCGSCVTILELINKHLRRLFSCQVIVDFLFQPLGLFRTLTAVRILVVS